MDLLKWIIAGTIGGLIGCAVWVGIGYGTGYEVGWIAWGVGFLAGVGVRIAAGETEGMAPGVVACVIAVAAVVGAKFLVVHLLVEKELGDAVASGFSFTEQDLIGIKATDITEEMEAAGKQLQWPENADPENPLAQSAFPKEVWDEATKRWNDLSEQDRTSFRQEKEDESRQLAEVLTTTIRDEAFKQSFAAFDLLWFGLAAFTAFKIGSGTATGE